MDLAIYGAQGMALGAYEAIRSLYPERNVRCFIVTERGINAKTLGGLPVVELNDFVGDMQDTENADLEILIVTPENVMPQIEETLDNAGLHCHERLTSVRWAQLMSYHYAKRGAFVPLAAYPIGCTKAEVRVYMAKFYKDKSLQEDYQIPEWIYPVQVGAALCEERVAEVLDCTGDNISAKNGNYSELTALYWAWKNGMTVQVTEQENAYYGLCHYRRILELSEDDILRMNGNGIDAVLPYPMPYEPSIDAHHERYLAQVDWEALLVALEELSPEYAKVLPDVLKQRYLYNYNIMILRAPVFRKYCEWLFPILERTEQLSVPRGSERHDRYIGYMGETLSTLYFMTNKDGLKIAHAGCRLLV